MVSFLLTCSTPWLSLIAVWCLRGATHRGQPWTPALTLPHVRDGLRVRLMAVLLSLSRFLSGMMRLRHHDIVTGGTTHGWCTVYRATVSPAGVPGFHQRDARRVSTAGPAL